ncbi:MAG: hypothetical protein RPU60_14525, partial [Candidatus Sedimenticola sp. (ex Thyasira tokunagai)]
RLYARPDLTASLQIACGEPTATLQRPYSEPTSDLTNNPDKTYFGVVCVDYDNEDFDYEIIGTDYLDGYRIDTIVWGHGDIDVALYNTRNHDELIYQSDIYLETCDDALKHAVSHIRIRRFVSSVVSLFFNHKNPM